MSDNPFLDTLNKRQELASSQNYDKNFNTINSENPFLDTLKKREEDKQNQINADLKQTLTTVMDKDPDMVGEGLKLAEELNLPKRFALDSEEAIKLLKEKNRKEKLINLQLAKKSPVLMRQLTDPTFAALAYDNIDDLEGLEYAFDAIKKAPDNISQGWEKGRLNVRRGKIGNLKKSGKSNEELNTELAEINQRLEQLNSDGSGILEEGFAIFGQYSKTLPTALEGGSVGAVVGASAGAVTGPGSIFTAKGGFLLGFLGTLGLETYKIEAGSTYLDLVKELNLTEGVDDQTAKHIATGVGVTNMLLEWVGASAVTAPIRKQLSKYATKSIVKELAKPTGIKAITQFAKNYFGGNLTEAGTEVLQELSNVVGRDLAVTFSDKEDLNLKLTNLEGLQEIGDRLGQTFIQTMKGMTLVGLVGSGPTFISDISRANKSTKDTAFIENLSEKSVNNKTKIRNPNEFQSFVENLAVDKDVQNLYIDAEILNQAIIENGITIEDIQQVSPDVAQQLIEINKSGGQGDVTIKTSEYAAKLAGTQFDGFLQDHLRVDQDGFSRAEATQFKTNQDALRQEAVEVIEKQNKISNEFAASATQVQKDITLQLQQVKQYTEKNIKYASTFFRDYVVIQANKLGISPKEFAARFPYTVVVQDQIQVSPEQQLFNQDGSVRLETPQFKNFFGKSVLKKDGKPEVLYHGTRDSVNEFNLDHPNKKDFGWLGKGVYMYRGKNAAAGANVYTINKRGDAGANIMPLYARLENPYYATFKEKADIRMGGEQAAEGFKQRLIDQGHDGAILRGQDGTDEVVVFDNAAVKSTFNSGTWSRETADILKQQELFAQKAKPQKKGKPVPDSVSQVNKLENSFDFSKSKPFPTNRQFKIELQDRVKKAAKKANIDVNDASVETEKYLVQSVIDDANFALIENSNAVGWYNEKVNKAKRVLALIHPELATDPVANFAFTWSLANTSNMIKVDKNFELAEIAYRHYKETGKFPTDIGIGKAAQAINANFKLFNKLIREKEFTDLEEFMKTQHTVKEVKAYTNDTVSGENESEIVYGAAVMGPKIGNGFFANLYGFFEQLTMDRWLIRSWGRLTGTLVLDQRKQANMKRDQLKPLLKALSSKQRKKLQDLIGIKIRMTNLDEVAVAIDNASTDTDIRETMIEIANIKDEPDVEQKIFDILGKPRKGSVRIGIGDEIRKNGISYTKFLDGQKESPKGAPERRFIRKVFNQALDVLQQDNPDLTMADLQALLWYPEKRLYDSAKLEQAEDTKGYVDDEAPDYANASVNLARKFGVLETDIQTTLQEVDLEIQNQSVDGARVAESGERKSDGLQQDNETFRQGRIEPESRIDERTGLPLNADGTVTVFHHTNRQSADRIRESNQLEYTTTTDPFFTTRNTANLGYGNTSIAIRLDPARLNLDDEFPDGRRDYRLNNRKAREFISVEIDENPNVSDFAPTQDQINKNVIDRVVKLGEPYMGEYGDKSPNEVDKQLRDKARDLFSTQAATPEEAAAARERIIEKTKLIRTRNNLEKRSNEFQQQEKSGKGRGGFDPKTLTTFLTTEADISTFFHETAHYMLTVMEDLAVSGTATPEIRNDFNVLLDFWGVENITEWSKLDMNQKRKYHEAFAYNYEIYITEKKAAPNKNLQDIFNKFGEWVRKVYKSIRDDLNKLYRDENGVDLPVLTDEVRAVMDRMIASEEQIIESQRVYGMKAMFTTQEESGMDNKTWQEYTVAIKQAQDVAIDKLSKSSMRQVKWLSNARSRVLKDLQKEVNATRKTVIAEETAKAENEKIYRLQKYLKRGETINDQGEKVVVKQGYKIDINSLKNSMPFYDMTEIIKKLGTGKYGMIAKKGMPVSLVAELFGYENPTSMINALVDLEPIKDVIKERTDQRMVDEFSNLTDPRQQELEVQEALHNEARARFIATELRFLTAVMQPQRLQVAAAKQVAKDILAKKTLREVRPTLFSRQEAKATKAAEKAMREGDNQATIQAKKAQLLNNQLAKEAVEVHKRYDKATANFKKIFKSDKKLAKTRNVDMVSAAKTILASYGFGPAVQSPNVYIQNLKDFNEELYLELEPIIREQSNLRNTTNIFKEVDEITKLKDIKDLAVEDFDTLDEVIQSLWHQSRREKQIVIEGEKLELEPIVNELIERMVVMPKTKKTGVTEAQSTLDKLHSKLQDTKAQLRRVEHWADGMDGADIQGSGAVLDRASLEAGAFTKYIWRPVKNSLNEYRTAQIKFTKKYAEMLEEVDFGNDVIVANEFDKPYTFGKQHNGRGKAELLGAMLHMGNKSNLRKLLLGRGWGKQNLDGTLDTRQWDVFIKRMEDSNIVTKKDYDFLQKVWNLNKEMLPLMQKTHRDIFGYYFKVVEMSPVITKYGTYEGGYVPAKVDPNIVKDAERNAKLEELKTDFKLSLPAVQKGFTMTRVEYNRELSLHLNAMVKHIDDALRFAYVQPAITDVLKIIKNKEFANALTDVNPSAIDHMLLPWLNNAARQKTMLRGENDMMDAFFKGLRKRTGVSIMFANFQNAVQQFTGNFPSLIKVEGKYMRSGLKQYYGNPAKTQEFIAQLSPFMDQRQNNQMFDIQDTLNDLIINPNKYEKINAWTNKHAYFIQQAFQNQVDSVVWIGSYNQFFAKKPASMPDVVAQKEAIAQADANVRLTQDSLLPEDRASYQTNTPLIQSLLQFTGYFNTMANLNATQYKKMVNDMGFKITGKGSGRLIYTFMLGLYMPAVISNVIVNFFGGNLGDQDEDGYLDETFDMFFFEPLRFGLAFIPGGNILPVPFNVLNDKPYDDRISTSPSISTLESSTTGTVRALQAAFDPKKDITGKNVKDVFTFMSLLSKYPLTILGRPLGYLTDVGTGRVEPEGPLDFIRGVVTGKTGRRQRK